MLFIESQKISLQEWAAGQMLGKDNESDYFAETLSIQAHDVFLIKAVMRQLAENSGFAQPDIVLNFDLTAEQTEYYSALAANLCFQNLQSSNPKRPKFEQEKLSYANIKELSTVQLAHALEQILHGQPTSYYLKPNDEALGNNVFNLTRDEKGWITAIALDNYSKGARKLPVFSYLDALSDNDYIQRRLQPNTVLYEFGPDSQTILRNVLGLHGFKGRFSQSGDLRIVRGSSLVESAFANLLKVNGRSYETRHMVRANIPQKTVENDMRHIAKFGGSEHFGTLTFLTQPELSDIRNGEDSFLPLLQNLDVEEAKVFVPRLEAQIRDYIMHIQERAVALYPSVVSAICTDSRFTLDLCWSLQNGVLVPSLIENHIEMSFR